MKKIFSGIFAVVFAVAVALPVALLTKNADCSFAKNDVIETILSPNFDLSAEDFAAVDKTKLQSTAYVPYDENENVLSGNALLIDGRMENLQFSSTSNTDLYFSSEDTSSDVSIFMWLFLPDAKLKNGSLTVVLSGKNLENADVSIELGVSGEYFYSSLDDPALPGWRYVELFLQKAVPNVSGQRILYRDLDKFSVYAVDEFANGCKIGVYDICLGESSLSKEDIAGLPNCALDKNSVNKYGLVVVDDNFVVDNCILGKLAGDTAFVPAGADVFEFAYLGGQKLTALSGGNVAEGTIYYNSESEKTVLDSAAEYRIEMKLTKAKTMVSQYFEVFNVRRNNVATFDEGEYYLQFVVTAHIGDDWLEFAQSKTFTINVKKQVEGIWFDTVETKLSAGHMYRYYFTVNTNYYLLVNIDDLEITSSNSDVLEVGNVYYTGGNRGYVELTAKKGGRADIVLQARLARAAGGSNKEESNLITINVFSKEGNSNNTLMIVFGSILSAGALGGIAYAIYAIIKHNKMGVK